MLIVIEGSDGSGKATQTKKLYNRLEDLSVDVIRVSFPDYDSESSALIKMYLRGDFGNTPEAVNPYAAAIFYAIDRFASFKNWQDFYFGGGIVLSDRYVGSNMAHQSAKLNSERERTAFLSWLDDLEHNRLQLPRPDLNIFLDMPPEVSAKLRMERGREDIHESDAIYMEKSYNAYKEIARRFGWKVIQCSNNSAPRSANEIHEEIFRAVEELLLGRKE